MATESIRQPRPSLVHVLLALGHVFDPQQVRAPLDLHYQHDGPMIEVLVEPADYEHALEIASQLVLDVEAEFGETFSIVVVPRSSLG